MVELEAAALSPSKAARKKKLPRELRGLALPDRDWNVAMPFFTTAAKTRDQFSSNADTHAVAEAAREHHQKRVAEEAAGRDGDPEQLPDAAAETESNVEDK